MTKLEQRKPKYYVCPICGPKFQTAKITFAFTHYKKHSQDLQFWLWNMMVEKEIEGE